MKSTNKRAISSFERAQKRVNKIKGFYNHLAVYVVVNAVLLLAKNDFTFYLVNDRVFDQADFLAWINWNTYGTLIFWGIGLVVKNPFLHGLSVFLKNPKFLGRAWEEKQIQKYMEKDS